MSREAVLVSRLRIYESPPSDFRTPVSDNRLSRNRLFDYRPPLPYYSAVPLVPCAVGIVHACVGFP